MHVNRAGKYLESILGVKKTPRVVLPRAAWEAETLTAVAPSPAPSRRTTAEEGRWPEMGMGRNASGSAVP